MSMFCEDCHTLLKKRKKGRGTETFCPRCSKRGGSKMSSGSDAQPQAMSFDELKRADSSFAAPPEMTDNHGKHPSIPYFPHPSVREGQSQFMKDAADAISQGKHLLAYAPTGIGKTVAALVPAISESLKSGKTIFFLTSKQSQHHIAVETLKVIKSLFNADIHVVDIISKQAMCPRDIAQEFHAAFNLLCRMSQKSGSCSYFTSSDEGLVEQINSTILHVEELKALAVGQKVCPHKVALKAGASSNIIVCDYNYIFDPDISESILESFGKPLDECIIIVDEAHNLPDRIRNYFTQSLTSNMLNEAISEVPNAQLAHILKGTRKELVKLLDAVEPGNEELISSEVLLSRMEAIMSQSLVEKMDMDSLINELQKVGEKRMLKGQTSAAAGVSEFLCGFRLNLRGLIRIVSQKDGSRLYFRLLDPSVISAPVFAEFHSSIVMSGTLFP
ncbi:MAG: DEAD/DEAH box helicase, partial [Thermoplasmata archaeon]|nr:DEAD/DEAH box helicase [Thermoplasmata archaeon]